VNGAEPDAEFDDAEFPRHYFAAVRFLHREAELLDDRRFAEWLALLTDDVEYRIPTRITRDRASGEPEFSADSYHLAADFGALKFRVARLDNEFAHAEESPSRTRRVVGNVRPRPGSRAGETLVRSNLIVVRGRWDHPSTLLAAERRDVLRRVGGDLKLAHRIVHLDHTTLPTQNLALLL
jgi:ethylbenzene dioxygenase subunit beta